VFVQTDSPAGNEIVSYQRSVTGSLQQPQTFTTGGDGAVAAGSAVDPLASQSSLTLADGGRVLLAVNAGSDSVSVFRVFGADLVLSQVVPSGGEFPSSIAVSGNLVYVMNAGGTGTLQGFYLLGNALRPIAGSTSSLGLSNTNPPFFLDAPGQVGFTPNGQQLIVTTKNSGSSIDVYSVSSSGLLSSAPTVNAAAGPVPFGFTFDQAGHLIMTQAGGSQLTQYSIAPDGTLTALGTVNDGQAALCWISTADGYFYGSNAGSANVSQFSETSTGALSLVGVAAVTDSGATDSSPSSDGQYLYVENGGGGTVDEYQIGAGGSLTEIGRITGLPAPMEGIAAS
jgi:6-phosphogluconolactonase (cycloisomerase 2 family)